SPIRIRIRRNDSRGIRSNVQTIGQHEANVAQDALHRRPMSVTRCLKILTYSVNSKGYIWTCDRQVLQPTNMLGNVA
uniref:Uncharacterized protein n=1 Tax=Triticum urartu TaxID=4572 RepID=A0A8R7P7Z7_TRIUA